MQHPQNESKKGNRAENLCAAFDRANGRWGHNPSYPSWYEAVDLVSASPV